MYDKNEVIEVEKQEVEINEEQLAHTEGLTLMKDAYKMAKVLVGGTMLPDDYKGNLANVMIATEMALRLNMSPMMVMQELYIVYGKPSWSGKMAAALVNGSRRYKAPLKYEYEYDSKGKMISCYAWTTDLEDNKVIGPKVTWEMVTAEGWNKMKKQMKSKWETIPELMYHYRASSFFARTNCPDVLMGVYTEEENIETYAKPPVEKVPDPFAIKEDVKEEEPEKVEEVDYTDVDLTGTPFENEVK